MSNVRVRIAPSPTGENLHIGNVYTALLNYAYARASGGKFIVRIEDTDRTRYVEGSETRILDSLKWLGISYDEGPDIGGPYAPYRQSERIELYKKYAEELVASGHAYYCVCSSERLKEMRDGQVAAKIPTIYDGTCKAKKLTKSQVEGKQYVIRLNVPDSGVTTFTDLIRGEIAFENKLIDDQVLLKSDGYPTYHLGVVVDDHCMEISHIIRAEEWISSTPKHILLYQAFGWTLPIFAHGPILRNPDRSKLSKRKNPVWVSWYREQGYLPEAILNYLALMGWSMPDEKELFTLDEFIKNFKLEDIKAVGPAFDLKKLDWMNGEYIRKMEISQPKVGPPRAENLKSLILEFIGEKYDADLVEKTLPLVRERIKKLSDYLPLAGFFYAKPTTYEIPLKGYVKGITETGIALREIKTWKANSIGETLQSVATKLGIKNSEYFMMIRVAITGKKISPPLNESMEILGHDEVIARLKQSIV
jgi:glutamyl-tRNA synthetase